MSRSVKIRTLTAPGGELTTFDPGEYIGGLEFYETEGPITEEDRDGLAQLAQFLAYLALKAKSTRWAGSTVARDTSAYRAFESHFGHLDGWQDLTQAGQGLPYGTLARFLMRHYPPHLPGSTERPGDGEKPR